MSNSYAKVKTSLRIFCAILDIISSSLADSNLLKALNSRFECARTLNTVAFANFPRGCMDGSSTVLHNKARRPGFPAVFLDL